MPSKKKTTDTVATTAPHTLTLDAEQIARIAQAVVPAASADDAPWSGAIFKYVQITAYDGYLWASATDRYKMGRAKLGQYTDDLPEAIIPAAWFKQATSLFLTRSLKGSKTVPMSVTLTYTPDTMNFRATGTPKLRALGDNPITVEYTYDKAPGEFPKLRHLLNVPAHEAEFASNATTLPPTSVLMSHGEPGNRGFFIVPPTEDRKTFAFVAHDGSWTWVGMPLRMPNPRPIDQIPADSKAVRP